MLSLDQIVKKFKDEIDTEPDSEEKVRKIVEFANGYFDTIGVHSIPILEEGIAIAKRINYGGGITMCLLNKFFYNFTNGNLKEAAREMEQIESTLDQIKDQPFEYTYVVNFLAYGHWYRGEFDIAFDKIFSIFKFLDQLKNHKEAGWVYYALGVFYFDTKDLSNAELYYNKAIEIFRHNNYDYGCARAQNGIASVKIRQGKMEEAIALLEFCITNYRKDNYYAGLARSLNDLALIEKSKKNYQRTIELFTESLEIRKEINHIQGLITTHTELGEIYLMLDDTERALTHLRLGIELSEPISAKYKSMRLHKLLSDTYKKTDDIRKAFDHFEKFHGIKSEVLSEETSNNIRKMQTKMETEKSEKEAEIERLKNVELKHANQLIMEKQKEILDSIRYAKRIQQSLLPTETYIERNLNRLQKQH